jgi:hypothetical protein
MHCMEWNEIHRTEPMNIDLHDNPLNKYCNRLFMQMHDAPGLIRSAPALVWSQGQQHVAAWHTQLIYSAVEAPMP